MSGPSIDPNLYRERDVVPIHRALVSVSDKTGLVELATALAAAASRSCRPGRPPRPSPEAGSRSPRSATSPATRSRSTDACAPSTRVHSGLLADLRLEAHEAELADAGHRAVRAGA